MDSPRPQQQVQSASPLPLLPHPPSSRRVASNPSVLRHLAEHLPSHSPRSAATSGGAELGSVPAWQPDAAAKQCPICRAAFTFFNRRHHCRKCGRVVCAACSPHRIALPAAAVVHPPPVSIIDLTSSSPSSGSSGSSISGSRRTSWILPVQVVVDDDDDDDGDDDDGDDGDDADDDDADSSEGGGGGGCGSSSVRICDDCVATSAAPHALSSLQQPQYQQQQTPSHRPRQRPSAGGRRGPPQLHENDYCPICHRALPLLPDPSEAGREAHISACLAPHVLAYSQPYSSGHNAPAAAGGRARSYTSGGRMVVWHAGAKDTCDPGTGDPIECVICFDEFVEGVEIARLECFCRYHKKCIREWFDRKGNGECPVHAVHD